MPTAPDAEKMKKAEKEIGENIPEEMKGLDTEDLGNAEPEQTAKDPDAQE